MEGIDEPTGAWFSKKRLLNGILRSYSVCLPLLWNLSNKITSVLRANHAVYLLC